MLERVSALASARPYTSRRLAMGEVTGYSLVQAAGRGKEKKITEIAGPLPKKVGLAMSVESRTALRVGPHHFWFVGRESDDLARQLQGVCAVTALTSSRTRIYLEGVPARQVLAKGMALDFHEKVFTPGIFAMTGLHHMPVTVHCLSDNRFELYALRTFALSVWDWLTDAAWEFTT